MERDACKEREYNYSSLKRERVEANQERECVCVGLLQCRLPHRESKASVDAWWPIRAFNCQQWVANSCTQLSAIGEAGIAMQYHKMIYGRHKRNSFYANSTKMFCVTLFVQPITKKSDN